MSIHVFLMEICSIQVHLANPPGYRWIAGEQNEYIIYWTPITQVHSADLADEYTPMFLCMSNAHNMLLSAYWDMTFPVAIHTLFSQEYMILIYYNF